MDRIDPDCDGINMNLIKLASMLFLLISFSFLGDPAGIFADARDEQLQKYQSLLNKLKSSPEHYNQLVKNYESFQALPREKQKALKDLDNAIHQLMKNHDSQQAVGKEKQLIGQKKTDGVQTKHESLDSARLFEVYQRFGEWYENLAQAEKQKLENATTPDARIAEIKNILTAQWVARLPKADADALMKLDESSRATQILKMKKEESFRVAQSFDKKKKTGITSEEAQKFINQIKLQMNADQLEKLTKLEGKKGAYVKMVVEIAEENPPIPLGRLGVKYLTMKDLPSDVSSRLKSLKQSGLYKQADLTRAEKKWPGFARAVTEIIRKNDPAFNFEFGACKLVDFPDEARTVVENELIPMLQEDEKTKLLAIEGKWPDFPLMVRDLARIHLVTIPDISIPPEILQSKPGKIPMILR